MPIRTGRKISANRPDIVIKNNRVKKCTLIDVAIPCDKNTSSKVSQKLPKYTYIQTYIHTHTHIHTHTYFINMTNTNTVYRSVTKKKITNKDLEIEFTKCGR